MPLNLSESTLENQFRGGISIDNLSWWFWIKAGLGFTFGASIIAVVGGAVWVFIIAPLFLRILLRGF